MALATLQQSQINRILCEEHLVPLIRATKRLLKATMTPDLERFFQSGAFDLERDFPNEYPAMCAIVSKVAPSAVARENDQLRYELADFAYGYSRDRLATEYRKQASDLEDKAKELFDTLDSVLQMMESLDSYYNCRLVEFMRMNPLLGADYGFGHLDRDLEHAKMVAAYLRLAIHMAGHFEARPSGRSRPRLPQFVPAVRLMDLWERLTRTKIVTPKSPAPGKNKPEAVQPSTEFVRLGLKMIDSEITAANTVTLIKRALTERRQNRAATFSELVEIPSVLEGLSALFDGSIELTDELRDLKKLFEDWHQAKAGVSDYED
ncbi:hypothetical protein AAFG13_18235 [Bradyrhizobium sp. B124]|uniref:hypothetical protein n=1 Tax=Bradyrhizobium sp. B124 TaxID=3140245 RepID=UPI00318335C0